MSLLQDSLAKQVPKELPSKVVLLYGSLGFSEEVERKQTITRRVGALIVSHPGQQLLTGGALGDEFQGGGVDFHGAMGAVEFLQNREFERERIITLLPSDSANGFFRVGHVLVDSVVDRQQRRRNLVAKADFIITIEGGLGTFEILQHALDLQRPLLPLGGTGGASESIWKRPELRESLLRLLQQDHVQEDWVFQAEQGPLESSEDVCGHFLEVTI